MTTEKFPPYPSYRRTEGWLERVPDHWTTTSLGKVTLDKCDGPFGSGLKSEHYTDAGIQVVRLQNIKLDGFSPGDPVYIDADHYNRNLSDHSVVTGDVLIAGLGDPRNPVGRACVAPPEIEPAMVKADCFRFRLDRRKVQPDFVALQLSASSWFASGMMTAGSTRARIPLSSMAKRPLAYCPKEEQTKIAKFLDYETAKIDALIEKQQQLIALLKEKRQAVISHAVTKGLNPDAPLRDSGVEWLGEVPAHWKTGKMKFFADLRSGHTPSRLKPEYWENCHIPWFSLADVWQLRDGKQLYLAETKEKISDLGLARSAADLLPAGTVILSRTASVGFSGIMPVPMATTQDFVNWIPGKSFTSEYLLFVFRGMSAEFDRLKMGSTHKTIYMPDVRQFSCPVPPLDEQKHIVSYLTDKLDVFEQATSRANDLMVLLKERRTALISAAVTGKIDVRDWQPPHD